jgi:hypothetical protein
MTTRRDRSERHAAVGTTPGTPLPHLRLVDAPIPVACVSPDAPAVKAEHQLRFERGVAVAQKAEEAFYHLPRILQRLDERDQIGDLLGRSLELLGRRVDSDKCVLQQVEHARAQIGNASIRSADRDAELLQAVLRLDARMSALATRLDTLAAAVEAQNQSHQEANLTSDRYSCQAIEGQGRLTTAVRDLDKLIRAEVKSAAALVLADQSFLSAERRPVVELISREMAVAAD